LYNYLIICAPWCLIFYVAAQSTYREAKMPLTLRQRFWTSKLGEIIARLPQLYSNLLERFALERRIRPGDYIIDGRTNHPVFVVSCELEVISRLGPWDYAITGISLVDGSEVIGNSAKHSGLTALTYEQAVAHLIVAFWTRGTGQEVWQAAADHVGTVLQNSPLYRKFTSQ
jgi:hypothetical protein